MVESLVGDLPEPPGRFPIGLPWLYSPSAGLTPPIARLRAIAISTDNDNTEKKLGAVPDFRKEVMVNHERLALWLFVATLPVCLARLMFIHLGSLPGPVSREKPPGHTPRAGKEQLRHLVTPGCKACRDVERGKAIIYKWR